MGLLRAEFYKLGRHVLLRWVVIALLGLVLLRGVVWPPDPDMPWAGLWSLDLIVVALIMLSAVFTGLEFGENTYRSLVSRGVPRWGFLISKFATLILAGGALLFATEGLATLLGVRPSLNWGELARAWLALWPYCSMVLLLTVLARNGGLALVVGVLWVPLEQAMALLMMPAAMLPETSALRFLSPDGALGAIYRWTLGFNGANWIYLGDPQRTPMPNNVALLAMPRPAFHSALVLAGYLALGLGLSLLVLYRRDVTVVVQGKKGRAKSRRGRRAGRRDRLPAWTGRGPIVARLVRAHLFKMGRTALPKIGLAVSLLFPLTLWGVAKALKATGLQDVILGSNPGGGSPMAMSISLMIVGPLATVIGALAVSNELSLGTRRAELTRAVTRLQSIAGQSLALVLTIGALYAIVMAVTVVLGAETSGVWHIGSAAMSVLIAALATGAYVGAVQIGGALTRSPLGAMVTGLAFLLADWFAILTPTLMIDNPGPLLYLGRLTVFANTFALASGGEIVGVGFDWQAFGAPAALLLLAGYALGSHALAALIARRRDA
jgi:ABC-type transport system involved in multi-copper enzyme maturation permease subunit